MSDWQGASEIVAGAAYKFKFAPEEKDTLKISPLTLRPELFYPPYDEFIEAILQEGATPEDIIPSHINTYQTTKYAVEDLNGAGHDTDWVVILEKLAAEFKAGSKLERFAEKLKRGEKVDWSKITNIISAAQLHENADLFTSLSDVDRNKIPFIPTGYEPLDKHMLGLPAVGVTVLFGPRKSGKTTLALQIAGSFIKTHKKKQVAFFSMEMLASMLAARMDQVCKLTKKEQKRFLVRDLMETPEEVNNRAAAVDDLGLVVVDFADLLVRGETTESAMGHVYRTLNQGAKQLRVPMIILAHPNRQYQGGLPRPEQIRWTGLATNLAELFMSTYDPDQNLSYAYTKTDDKILRPLPGRNYLIVWGCRAGFRIHKEDHPGAICIPFQGKRGWHPDADKCRWFKIQE